MSDITVASNRVLWQVAPAGRPAWSFEAVGEVGRCRLAFDPVSALRLLVAPGGKGMLVSAPFMADCRLRRLSPPRSLLVADRSGPPGPEDAAALVAAGFDGARYPVAQVDGAGLDLFGSPGERTGWRRASTTSLPVRVLAQAEAEAGIKVAPIPTLAQLKVSDP